ncbi:MAG: hypothetical protein H0V47_02505 [Chloroflexia bacterium]|nr:hypothetical protein [Chloroflexia bacterium]
MSPERRTVPAFIHRFRGVFIVLGVIAVTWATAAAISAFGDSGIEEAPSLGDGVQRVRTGGERCAVPLMEGWTWRGGSSTLISPNGTTVGFSETLHGRPMYPEWEETVHDMASRYEGRDDVTVTEDDTTLRIDFGPGAGLSVTQRFDRVGCHLTFAPPADDVRAREGDSWEELVRSVERVFPQEGLYTREHQLVQPTGGT